MKRILFIITIAISIIIINNLIHSIYSLWQKRDLVTNAQKELKHQKLENQRLKSELSYIESKEFIEKEARDKLLLVKPGEELVIISDELIKKNKEEKGKENDPNWKKWLQLFF